MTVTVDIDLRPSLGVVRDQGGRPTCSAFATSAAHELHRGQAHYLSVEYLYFMGAQRSHQDPRRGLSLQAVCEALEHDGQPEDAAWPYSIVAPKKKSWGVPPGSPEIYKSSFLPSNRTVQDIKSALAAGHAIILGLGISPAFYLPDANARVLQAAEVEVSKHAVLAVGVGHDNDGSYVLVRNSWGENWGQNGHAWLHDDYVSARLLHSAGMG